MQTHLMMSDDGARPSFDSRNVTSSCASATSALLPAPPPWPWLFGTRAGWATKSMARTAPLGATAPPTATIHAEVTILIGTPTPCPLTSLPLVAA